MAVIKFALDALKMMVVGLREISLPELIVAIVAWAAGVAAALLTTVGLGRKYVVKRFLVAFVLWAVLTAGSFVFSFLHPSSLAYAGLGLLVLWYLWIPILLALVSIAWFLCAKGQKSAERVTPQAE
jgi:hypothetical protein